MIRNKIYNQNLIKKDKKIKKKKPKTFIRKIYFQPFQIFKILESKLSRFYSLTHNTVVKKNKYTYGCDGWSKSTRKFNRKKNFQANKKKNSKVNVLI